MDHSADKALIETGGGSSLEQSFCQCVLDGRLPPLVHDAAEHIESAKLPATPFRVGAHLSSPIILADGQIYSTEPDPTLRETDLQKLEVVARHTARRIDLRRQAERNAQLEKCARSSASSRFLHVKAINKSSMEK
ncbi:hypothetical protein ACQYWY_09905 [Comamonas sediminis]|uniref:hypothetical protein n=1 Tax=Comamonas sediminis TaxID=1783360 RepID=UPI003D2C3A9E